MTRALPALPLRAVGARYVLPRQPFAILVAAIGRDVPPRLLGLSTVEARAPSRIGFEVRGSGCRRRCRSR